MSPDKFSFILIVDSIGDPIEVLLDKTDVEDVINLLQYYEEAAGNEHTAWRYDAGKWSRIISFDAIRVPLPAATAIVPAVPTHRADAATIDEMMRRSDERERAFLAWAESLTSNSDLMGGAVTYPGTRITISAIVSLLDRGVPRHEIVASYPDISDADVEFTKMYISRGRGGS